MENPLLFPARAQAPGVQRYSHCSWMGLLKCKLPPEVPWKVWPRLCSPACPGLVGKGRTGPSQRPFQRREAAKRCHFSLEPHQQLRLSNVTQCPVRVASTSSPHLIFPKIWLMLVLPPKKGCQGRRETANVVIQWGLEGSQTQRCNRREGKCNCLTSTVSGARQNES